MVLGGFLNLCPKPLHQHSGVHGIASNDRFTFLRVRGELFVGATDLSTATCSHEDPGDAYN